MIRLSIEPFKDFNRLSDLLQTNSYDEIKSKFSDGQIIRCFDDGGCSVFDLNYGSICVTIQKDKDSGRGIIIGEIEYYSNDNCNC